ncbi:hypothetical protein CAURIM_04840 [Corynebacterium aurimucosum]|nr:hypothetical protein CAURIM_04840 [Corynebacterium aurimucosum]
MLVDDSLLSMDNFAKFEIFGNFLAMGSVDPNELKVKAAPSGRFLEKDCERNRDSRAF